MKLWALLLLSVLAVPAAAQPVHVALKSAAVVSPDTDGFFTLGSVAEVTGGEKSLRTRLASILVGRAPLSGETRRLTRGDLALKLRQAGCDPDKATVLEGADIAEVTVTSSPRSVGALLAAPSASPAAETAGQAREAIGTPTTSAQTTLIHRGDAVTIVIQSGPLTIHADGTARENGTAGQTIRVHRDGVMTDLSVQVIDAHTVQLEI